MTQKQIITPILILLAINIAYAQGLRIDDEAYNLLPKQSTFGDGSKSENEALSGITKIDLRPYCPKPQNQGNIGSCTGWSSGYGATTILEAIPGNLRGQTDSITKAACSALFVYNQIKDKDCDGGSFIGDAAKLLKSKGNVPSKKFDKVKSDCNRQPTEADLEEAQRHRIKDFMTLFQPSGSEKLKVEKTKLSLVQNRPVVIGMHLRASFSNLTKRDEFWFPAAGDQTDAGAHAMVVVGFDDGKEAFEIMNSWGTDWGNGGFIWVKYKDYGELCFYGFQFIGNESQSVVTSKIYEGSFMLRTPFFDAQDNLKFSSQNLYRNGKYYELSTSTVERGFTFQPLIYGVTSGMYLYAFSYDVEKKIKVHWPRDRQFDDKFDQTPESAIITTSSVKLAIPGEDAALQLNKQGKEYLCLLFSKDPLVNFNNGLEKLKTYKSGDFYKNLSKAFGSDMVSDEVISYKNETPGYSANFSKGLFVPIIVQINVR
jgi:hypothetical protein